MKNSADQWAKVETRAWIKNKVKYMFITLIKHKIIQYW